VRVGIRCDAGTKMGAGHLIRCIAFAEELLQRGAHVVFLGSVTGPRWLTGELTSRGLPLVPAGTRLDLTHLVIDSYTPQPVTGEVTVLAIVDGDTRGQQADLFVDQNLGSPLRAPNALVGPDFVLLRDSVRRLRPARPRLQGSGTPNVLCFFGGTDAANAAHRVLALAASTGAPFNATVITETDLTGLVLAPGQSVTTIAPTPGIAELAVGADLVLAAAGTSVWELLCLGVPAALITVADNQLLGYNAVVSERLAAGLGPLCALRPEVLGELLRDPGSRTALAVRGHGLIDGRGRERVADALLRADPR